MVNLSDLKPGMKVKIVDRWVRGCYIASGGGMDHWLGQIVTVREVVFRPFAPYFLIEEDRMVGGGDGLMWAPASIDCIVSDDKQFSDPEFSPASDDAFYFLLSAGEEESHG